MLKTYEAWKPYSWSKILLTSFSFLSSGKYSFVINGQYASQSRAVGVPSGSGSGSGSGSETSAF